MVVAMRICYNFIERMVHMIKWTNITVRLGALRPWASNPRMSSKTQAKKLLESWKKFGQVQTVTVSPDLDVYDGHQRLSALLTVYDEDYVIDARQSDRLLTDDERKELVVTLHAGAVGSWDWDKLKDWSPGDLKGWGMDVTAWQQDVTAFSAMLRDERAERVEATSDKVSQAARLLDTWQVQPGDTWELGEHRLICDDSSDPSVVEELVGEELATLVMADPPYNVAYTSGSTNDEERPDSFDVKMTDEEYVEFLSSCLFNAHQFSDGYAALMLWCAVRTMRATMTAFASAGWTERNLIAWNKINAHYGSLGVQYKYKFEPLWYCYKPGSAPRFYGATNECTVWDYPQPKTSKDHPTMKPESATERIIVNHSEEGGIILELFLGSGTTLLAAETLNRRCRAVDISPGFCAVTLARWADMTGKTPVLIQRINSDG